MNDLIYLASPYSHPDAAVREARFHAVCRAAAFYLKRGICVFSPIAHSHPIAVAGRMETGFTCWKMFDSLMMDRCDSMIVLMLDGWKESQGIAEEIAYMESAGKPVMYVELIAFGGLADVLGRHDG